jgi:hypothetical protein
MMCAGALAVNSHIGDHDPLLQALLELQPGSPGAEDGEVEPRALFQQAMAQFELSLLRRQLQLLSPATATQEQLTCCSDMLASVASKAGALAMEGHDVSAFEAACNAAEAQLAAAAAERAQQQAQLYELPPVPADDPAVREALLGAPRLPGGPIPSQRSPQGSQSGLEAARRRANQALGSLAAGPGLGVPLEAALQQLSGLLSGAKGEVALQHALRSTERQLFSRAVEGLQGPGCQLDQAQLPLLDQVVDGYLAALQQFRSSGASKASMQVELRSRSVLVAWVAYCLAWRATSRGQPVLGQYGVALQVHQLRHLALDDRPATDAALAVAAFLQEHFRRGREAFSLRDGGAATDQLAEQFVAACPRLTAVLQQQQRDAATRVEAHWQEVQRKQKRAGELRVQQDDISSELTYERAELSRLREEYPATWNSRRKRYDDTSEVVSQRSIVSIVESRLTSVQSSLATTLRPPEHVIQPLPQDYSLASRWVFFLHMPQPLRILARLGFLAQQLLLPVPLDDESTRAIKVGAAASSQRARSAADLFQKGLLAACCMLLRAACCGVQHAAACSMLRRAGCRLAL